MPDTGNIIIPNTFGSAKGDQGSVDINSPGSIRRSAPLLDVPKTPRNPALEAQAAADADIARNHSWVNDVGLTGTDIRVNTGAVKRYAASHLYDEIGYSPYDDKLENKYGDAQGALERTGKNLLKFGANVTGALLNGFITLPNMISSVANGDMSGQYDNEASLAITEWMDGLETSLPNFQTSYKAENPFLSYINPLEWDSLVENWTGVVKNLGHTVGSFAAAMIQDAAVGAFTGGTGLAPMIGMQLTRLGKFAKIMSAGDKAKDALRLAAQGGQAVDEAVTVASNASRIINGFRYGLSSLTAAVGEGTFESVRVFRDTKDDLIQQYKDKYGEYPNPQAMDRIEKLAKGAGNSTLLANSALLLATNALTWGSLLKPVQAAERQIAREVTKNSSLKMKNLNEWEAVLSPTKGFKGIMQNTLASKGTRTMAAEGFEEGAQFVISTAATDYYKRKFDADAAEEIWSASDSIKHGLNEVLFSVEGRENILGGALGGRVGQVIMNKVNSGRGIKSDPLSIANAKVTALNSQSLTGIFDTTHGGATTAASLLRDYKTALQSGDIFKAKNLKMQQFYNFVETGVKADKFDLRMEQLAQLKDLNKEQFQTLFGIESDMDSRRTVNEFVNKAMTKAEAIKKNVDRVNRAFANPYNQRKDSPKYKAYESYKTQLGLSLTQIQDNKNRVETLTSEISDLAYNTGIANAAVAYTHAQGVRGSINNFQIKISDLDSRIKMVEDNPQLTEEYQKERDFLARKVDVLRTAADRKENEWTDSLKEEYLTELGDMYQYHANAETLSEDNPFTPLDVLEIHNKAFDVKQLTDSSRDAQDYYKKLLTKEGLNEHFALFANLSMSDNNTIDIDANGNFTVRDTSPAALAAESARVLNEDLGVSTLEEGEKKIDEADKELIAKLMNEEDAKGILDGTTPITDDIKEAAKERLRNQVPEDYEVAEDMSLSRAERFEKSKKENDINDDIEDEDIREVVKAKAPAQDPSEIPDSSPRATGKNFWKGMLFNPFTYLNKLYARKVKKENIDDRSTLEGLIISGDLSSIDNIRIEISESVHGNTPDQKTPVTYFAGDGKGKPRNFSHIVRAGFATDVTVYAGDKVVGLMHPPESLQFKRGTEYLTMDQLTDATEYARVTMNPASTFEQFKQDYQAYKNAYDTMLQGFDGTVLSIDNTKFKSIFSPLLSFGRVDIHSEAKDATPINKLQYRGKGDAIISMPTILNEETGKYERGEVTILNEDELTEEQVMETYAYIADNMTRIDDMVQAGRYGYIMRMPDGKLTQQSFLTARPINEAAPNLEGFLVDLKEAVNFKNSADRKRINTEIGQAVYIAHKGRTKAKTKTNARFSIDENGGLALTIYNRTAKVNKKLVIKKAELVGAQDFSQFLGIVNSHIEKASETDKDLQSLKVTLSPESFKQNIPADDVVDIETLEKNLTLPVHENVFVEGNIHMLPVGSAERVAVTPTRAASTPAAALPQDLRAAKPRYSYGEKQFQLEFVTDLDKAAYVIAQKTPSKRDADFLDFVMKTTGMTEAEARAYGMEVKNAIKAMAKDGTPGVLRIPDQKAPKAVASTPAATVPGITTEVITPAAPKPVPTDIVSQNFDNIINQLKTKGIIQTNC